jgi:hypothetical protein
MDITNIGYLLIISIWKKLEIYRIWYIHVGFYLLVGSFFSKEKITFYYTLSRASVVNSARGRVAYSKS